MGGVNGLACRVLPTFSDSIQYRFQIIPGLQALTWTPSTPLYVFFDPAVIGLSAEGKNLGNEALIFHEALHGFTNLDDDDLQRLLGAGGPTCSIDEHIKVEVLFFAPALNLSTAYDCH